MAGLGTHRLDGELSADFCLQIITNYISITYIYSTKSY